MIQLGIPILDIFPKDFLHVPNLEKLRQLFISTSDGTTYLLTIHILQSLVFSSYCKKKQIPYKNLRGTRNAGSRCQSGSSV